MQYRRKLEEKQQGEFLVFGDHLRTERTVRKGYHMQGFSWLAVEEKTLAHIEQRVQPGAKVLQIGKLPQKVLGAFHTKGCQIAEVSENALEEMTHLDVPNAGFFEHCLLYDALAYVQDAGALLHDIAPLLAKNGLLYAVFPNIAHNATLVELYVHTGRSIESATGQRQLARFYSRGTMDDVLSAAGYVIVDEVTVEQSLDELLEPFRIRDMDVGLRDALLRRPGGNISHFIVSSIKREFYAENRAIITINRAPLRRLLAGAVLYLDYGEGFWESNRLEAPLEFVYFDCFTVRFDISAVSENVCGVRFDPYPLPCRVRIESIISDQGVHAIAYHNANTTEDGMSVFLHSDPAYILVEADWSQASSLVFTGRFALLDANELPSAAEEPKDPMPASSSSRFRLREIGKVLRRRIMHTVKKEKDARVIQADPLPQAKEQNELAFLKEYVAQVLKIPHQGPECNDYVPFHDVNFALTPQDVKAIAFYLPQFYAFEENDRWWGKGFTEWTNVTKAIPQFPGHYQPRLAGELGYYALDRVDTLQAQIELAHAYGVHGFCLYYYWFNGKELMDKPLSLLREHPDLDIPFCLDWANANWTRTWLDGNSKVLMPQTYPPGFAEGLARGALVFAEDPRYIRVKGRPLFLIHRPDMVPDLERSLATIRQVGVSLGVGEPFLMSVNFGAVKPMEYKLFDGILDVEPEPYTTHALPIETPAMTTKFSGKVYDYGAMVAYKADPKHCESVAGAPHHQAVCLAWDNTARRKENCAQLFVNYSIPAFREWLRNTVRHTRDRMPAEEQFFFINAWNEWGEGTYLEPDRRYGYAALKEVRDVILEARDS